MDEQAIAEAGRSVARLDLADHILSWDKKQATPITVETSAPADRGTINERHVLVPNPDARRCAKDPAHGVLQIHASGAQLMCCVTRPTVCDYAEPVSR